MPEPPEATSRGRESDGRVCTYRPEGTSPRKRRSGLSSASKGVYRQGSQNQLCEISAETDVFSNET